MAPVRLVLLPSALLGPASWRPTAEALAAAGASVQLAPWPKFSAVEGGYYAGLVEGAAQVLKPLAAPLVLVGHGAAGPLLPSLARAIGASVAGVLLVDALLPHPGRSWLDTAPDPMRQQLRAGAQMGQLPPWDDWWPPGALERLVPDAALRGELLGELEPLPLAYFEEPAPMGEIAGPAAYLQLSGSYEDEARIAGRMGWPVVRLPLNHLAAVTQPQAVASAITSLASRLLEPANG